MKSCPRCGASARDDDQFCEADGARLAAAGESAPMVAGTIPSARGGSCGACGAIDADAGDGYCSACGHRLGERRALDEPALSPLGPPALASKKGNRSVARERPEIYRSALVTVETDGASAATHPGLHRDYNEDAMAIAGEPAPWCVMVVCDGVSSSSHGGAAAEIAATAARDALVHFVRTGGADNGAEAAMAEAIRKAHLAVCERRIPHAADEEPPGTTLVAALVYRQRATVGWVGDSRAYWVTGGGGELWTRDHSWANEAVEQGQMTEEEAMHAPLAHALTRCLGPLEVGDTLDPVEPEVRARDLAGPGHLILCSDGLWNYFSSGDAVAELVRAAGSGANPGAIAHHLVERALDEGGLDNVTVAVHAHAG